ncbi:hypothetical protein [Dietzia sp. ANT_WB102]|uniref:hypothetical protein n=1 Tax=Dietzia sp. ANT_WB102 TaxID=2597345 RepID=UPI0011EFA889|nr:hypothetical protein [Dietzia sp. ANT_WB102]KAA0919007.1 hypothetical protein FQ137_06870 [Dietzia sp. ANT_WB102]
MRNRVLFAVSATALVAASCAQPDPQVLSEAPLSVTASEIASPAATTERDEQPGRFIARCATEADGGTPGLTIFTDGSRNVTDHCLSRYYIGVQPAPGALYVPDEEAGTYAPPSTVTPGGTTSEKWTPAQPRTDIGFDDDRDMLDEGESTAQPDDPETSAPGTENPVTPVTSPDEASPTTPPVTSPGGTEPTTPGTTTPGATTPGTTTPGATAPGDDGPAGPESSEPTAVPTVTEAPQVQQPGPLTSVLSTSPSAGLGTAGPEAPIGGEASVRFPAFRWPGSFWPGGPQN